MFSTNGPIKERVRCWFEQTIRGSPLWQKYQIEEVTLNQLEERIVKKCLKNQRLLNPEESEALLELVLRELQPKLQTA